MEEFLYDNYIFISIIISIISIGIIIEDNYPFRWITGTCRKNILYITCLNILCMVFIGLIYLGNNFK